MLACAGCYRVLPVQQEDFWCVVLTHLLSLLFAAAQNFHCQHMRTPNLEVAARLLL
jgi:hypothetical protein